MRFARQRYQGEQKKPRPAFTGRGSFFSFRCFSQAPIGVEQISCAYRTSNLEKHRQGKTLGFRLRIIAQGRESGPRALPFRQTVPANRLCEVQRFSSPARCKGPLIKIFCVKSVIGSPLAASRCILTGQLCRLAGPLTEIEFLKRVERVSGIIPVGFGPASN